MSELTILVPTRGRPHNISPILEAWRETEAFSDGACLYFLLDSDDPAAEDYVQALKAVGSARTNTFLPMVRQVRHSIAEQWRPMVPKLNGMAAMLAKMGDTPLGFAGDDHLPRTVGWVRRYVEALRETPAIVSCPDGIRGDNLPTQWAMSAEIVRALGRMVPAPVEHLYCDNSVRDLAATVGCYRYLPDVLIEHVHPMGGKAPMDAGYEKVNGSDQYLRDRAAYATWRYAGLSRDAERISHG